MKRQVCDVIVMVRLQGKFEIEDCWSEQVNKLYFAGISGTPTLQCSPLAVPQCQGLGYDQTIWSEQRQKKRASANQLRLNMNYTVTLGEKCGKMISAMDCESLFPPCMNGRMLFRCRHRCYEDLEACPSYADPKTVCDAYPVGDGLSDFCTLTHWPPFDEWRKVPTTLSGQFTTSHGVRMKMLLSFE